MSPTHPSTSSPPQKPYDPADALSPNAYPNSIVPRVFRSILSLGTIFGSQLLSSNNDSKPSHSYTAARVLKLVLFSLILCMYLLSLTILLATIFPTPDERQLSITEILLDVRTVFAGMLICMALDGMFCFFFMNAAHNRLSRENGFFDQFRRAFYARVLDDRSIREWKFFVGLSILLAFGYTCQKIVFLTLASAGVLNMPLSVSRTSYYLGLPIWVIFFILTIAAGVSSFQITYHFTSYSILCDICRLRFRNMCHRLRKETPSSFHQSRIDNYHAEYRHLADVVERLDHVFQYSVFVQFGLLAASICFSFMFFTKGETDASSWSYVGLSCASAVLSFLYTVGPAIGLRHQARRPQRYLYHWFVKYQTRIKMLEGGLMHEPSRNAFALFIQSLMVDDIGITAAGLFYFDGSVLLTMISVVGTYFFFIIQFGGDVQKANCNCNQTMNSSASMLHVIFE